MYLLIFSFLLATSFADLRTYVPPHFGGSTRSHLGGVSSPRFVGSVHHTNGLVPQGFPGSHRGDFGIQQPVHDRFNGGSQLQGFVDPHPGFSSREHISCGEGEILTFDGRCVEADVSKSVYLFSTPTRRSRPRSRPAFTPKPKLNYNVVFVRAPESEEVEEPVIIPPPQQKTIVYVLSKSTDSGEQQVIELPGGPSLKPDVYYVNYKDGENPELSLGLDLEGALASAVNEEARTILSRDEADGHFSFSGESRFKGHSGFSRDETDGHSSFSGETRFEGHSGSSGEHSGFERTQEFHADGPEHSSGEDDVQRHHFSPGFTQQPSRAYGLPSRK